LIAVLTPFTYAVKEPSFIPKFDNTVSSSATALAEFNEVAFVKVASC
jgi:hypothetical protein